MESGEENMPLGNSHITSPHLTSSKEYYTWVGMVIYQGITKIPHSIPSLGDQGG